MQDFLGGVPQERVMAAMGRAPGGAVRRGKFGGPDCGAVLVANAFGWFLDRPGRLPPLPGVPSGPVQSVDLAVEMQFPWSGGRHPWLDVALGTATTLVGIAATRYEPFRPGPARDFSDVYDRPVWGANMARYRGLAVSLIEGRQSFAALDAVTLLKQAYGLRTRAEKRALGAVLVYLYAEPAVWASGKPVDPARKAMLRDDIARFGRAVAGDDVVFVPLCWGDLLRQWAADPALATHAQAVQARFGDLG